MNIVLLAFDGLSKKDVDDSFLLNPFQQFDYYDEIDLGDRNVYYTSELFTDLITGETREEHGVKGLNKVTEGGFGLNPTGFETWLQENLNPLFFQTKQYRDGLYKMFLGSDRVKWERGDIEMDTIFERYDAAYQGQIPTWDWRKADVFHHLKGESRAVEKSRQHIVDEWHRSRRKFNENIESLDLEGEDNIVYMHHFHYIDWLQHLYRQDLDRVNEHFGNAAEFFDNVVQRFEDDDDTVVIGMSDHGLPERGIGHRPNAFVTCSDPDLLPSNPSLQELNEVLESVLSKREVSVGGRTVEV